MHQTTLIPGDTGEWGYYRARLEFTRLGYKDVALQLPPWALSPLGNVYVSLEEEELDPVFTTPLF
jgi:hypothetical protein